MKIIDDDDRQVKRLGGRNDDMPIDPTIKALNGLTKAVESIKAAPPTIIPSDGDGLKHEDAMAVLNKISRGIDQLTKQLTKKPSPGKWHFELVRDRSGRITSVEATKK